MLDGIVQALSKVVPRRVSDRRRVILKSDCESLTLDCVVRRLPSLGIDHVWSVVAFNDPGQKTPLRTWVYRFAMQVSNCLKREFSIGIHEQGRASAWRRRRFPGDTVCVKPAAAAVQNTGAPAAQGMLEGTGAAAASGGRIWSTGAACE